MTQTEKAVKAVSVLFILLFWKLVQQESLFKAHCRIKISNFCYPQNRSSEKLFIFCSLKNSKIYITFGNAWNVLLRKRWSIASVKTFNLLIRNGKSCFFPAGGTLANRTHSCCSGHFVWTPVSTQRREQLISDLIISCSHSLLNSIIPLLWHNAVSTGYLTCAVMLIRGLKVLINPLIINQFFPSWFYLGLVTNYVYTLRKSTVV